MKGERHQGIKAKREVEEKNLHGWTGWTWIRRESVKEEWLNGGCFVENILLIEVLLDSRLRGNDGGVNFVGCILG